MVYRLPPLNGLRAFETAARHLSFQKAAAELNVTPAALSYQVRNLEDVLGVKLFRRLNRAIALTDAGQRCIPKVREGFEALDAGMATLRRVADDKTLMVNAGPALVAKRLAPRLYRLIDRYPELDIRITASRTSVDFDAEDVDVALRFGRGNWPGLVAHRLLDESVTPMCSPSFAERHTLTRPEDLAGLTLLHDESLTPIFDRPIGWSEWFEAAGVRASDTGRGLRFNHADHGLDAAIDGSGIVLGRRIMAARDLASGRLVAPFDLELETGISLWFVCREGEEDRTNIAAFRDWMFEEATASRRAPRQYSRTRKRPT